MVQPKDQTNDGATLPPPHAMCFSQEAEIRGPRAASPRHLLCSHACVKVKWINEETFTILYIYIYIYYIYIYTCIYYVQCIYIYIYLYTFWFGMGQYWDTHGPRSRTLPRHCTSSIRIPSRYPYRYAGHVS